jgi:hypothetical protein
MWLLVGRPSVVRTPVGPDPAAEGHEGPSQYRTLLYKWRGPRRGTRPEVHVVRHPQRPNNNSKPESKSV